jgi:NHL repeat
VRGSPLFVGGAGQNVAKLAAGSATTTKLLESSKPPTSPYDVQPYRVAADSAGDLYVADTPNNRVVELAVGSATPSVLPFNGLYQPLGVTVDAAGNVYVTEPAEQPGAEAVGGVTPRTAAA